MTPQPPCQVGTRDHFTDEETEAQRGWLCSGSHRSQVTPQVQSPLVWQHWSFSSFFALSCSSAELCTEQINQHLCKWLSPVGLEWQKCCPETHNWESNPFQEAKTSSDGLNLGRSCGWVDNEYEPRGCTGNGWKKKCPVPEAPLSLILSTKTNAQLKSWELCFIQQIKLRN